jgi:tetratricopeptide (TPR) repeat protein
MATPTPDAVALPADPPYPPAPSCEQLKAVPGEITTSKKLRERIDVALRENDLVERRDRLIGIMCMYPDEKVVRLQLAASWLLLGANDVAIEELQPLLTDEGEVHEEHRALALSYSASAKLRMGDLDGAIEDARGAEERMPGLYSATYVLGEAYYLKKDFGNALAALLSAYRAAPGFASAIDHEILAQLLEARGSRGEAVLHRVGAARLEPNRVEQWKTAARTAESAGHWARAHEAWHVIASSSLPGLAESGQALSSAARAAVAAPKDPEIALMEGALLAERKNDLKKAISLLDQAAARNKLNLAARFHLARLLYGSGNEERALQEVSRVLDLAPKWAPALILSGDLERKRGEKERAHMRYEEANSLGVPLSMVAKWRLAELEKN